MDKSINESNEEVQNVWPKDRKSEIGKLIELITILSNINNSTGFLENMKKAIKLAKDLNKFDVNNPKPKFTDYLISKAHGE